MPRKLRFAFLTVVVVLAVPAATAHAVARMPVGFFDDPSFRWSTQTAENLASAKEILDSQLPKQPQITGGELIANDHAVLEVEGVPYENGRMLYLVEMRWVDGRWVYETSSVAGLLRDTAKSPK